ncbi:MAG: CAP domain-containing protein, partial [Cyanobacteria bacterium J06648_11]
RLDIAATGALPEAIAVQGATFVQLTPELSPGAVSYAPSFGSIFTPLEAFDRLDIPGATDGRVTIVDLTVPASPSGGVSLLYRRNSDRVTIEDVALALAFFNLPSSVRTDSTALASAANQLLRRGAIAASELSPLPTTSNLDFAIPQNAISLDDIAVLMAGMVAGGPRDRDDLAAIANDILGSTLTANDILQTPLPEPPPIAQMCQQNALTSTFTGRMYLQEPDVPRCVAGQLTDEAAQFAIDRLNFLRGLHDLEPVLLGPDLLAKSQQAALMMTANDQLDHSPPTSWGCYSSEGDEAAGSSNIGITRTSNPDLESLLANQVDRFFLDGGQNNFDDVGHRRWNLYPQYSRGAYGVVVDLDDRGFNIGVSNWVFESDASRTNPDFVAFPAEGMYLFSMVSNGFSSDRIADYRWSFSVNVRRDSDLGSASVRVTNLDTNQAISVSDVVESRQGFGLDTITYSVNPSSISPNTSYRIDIDNVTVGGAPRTYSYTTYLADCSGSTFPNAQRPVSGIETIGPPPTTDRF